MREVKTKYKFIINGSHMVPKTEVSFEMARKDVQCLICECSIGVWVGGGEVS